MILGSGKVGSGLLQGYIRQGWGSGGVQCPKTRATVTPVVNHAITANRVSTNKAAIHLFRKG